jgi:hypothetical protein
LQWLSRLSLYMKWDIDTNNIELRCSEREDALGDEVTISRGEAATSASTDLSPIVCIKRHTSL